MKKVLFCLVLLVTVFWNFSYNVSAQEVTTEEITIEADISNNEITPMLWVEGSYYLSSSGYTEVAWEVNNWLVSNVNVTNASYNPGSILFYVKDSNDKIYSTTEVAPGETKTINGIPRGGYRVYAKAKSTSEYYVLIIDDWSL